MIVRLAGVETVQRFDGSRATQVPWHLTDVFQPLNPFVSLNFGNGVSKKAAFVISRIFFTAPGSETEKGRSKKEKGI